MDFCHTELDVNVLNELAWLFRTNVRGDSTPGFPLNTKFATNAQARDVDFDLIVWAAFERLQLLSVLPSQKTARENVAAGLSDPISIFIKGEPHSKEKVEAKRFRLIHGMSLLDQLVERFLFHRYQNFCIAHYANLPFKSGWGDTEQDWQRFAWLFDGMTKPVSTDVSAWDFCVNEDQHDFITEFRLAAIKFAPLFERIVRNFMQVHKTHMMIFTGGHVYEQQFKGLWNSGRYATASANSECRSFLAFEVANGFDGKAVERPLAVTMGDDCVEDTSQPTDQLVAAYRERGFNLKVSGELEFCSHVLTPNGVHFQNFNKTIFRLACDPSLEHYNQLKSLFRTKEQIDLYSQLLPLVQQLNAVEEEEVGK